MILDDLKQLIIENNLVKKELIKYDYDSSEGNDVILLHLYDNTPCDLARRSKIKIEIKLKDLEKARNYCFTLHDILFPNDNFQKSIIINKKTMHAKLNQGPFYNGHDESKRHNYLLDISLTYDR